MNSSFIKRCDEEIENNKRKGEWSSWEPNEKELINELMWHQAKLSHAIFSKNLEKIKEFSADIANICEKSFLLARVFCSTSNTNKKQNKATPYDYEDYIDYF